MKLIIDVSEEAKRHIDTFKGKFLCGDGCDIISAIQNGTPCADIRENITGEWIEKDIPDTYRWKCSCCGLTRHCKENFCPNCGADMRGKENE